MVPAVMFDSAQFWYQVGLANQIGDATPTMRLFQSDDTPTAGTDVSSLEELSNDSYAPVPVPNGFWQLLFSPPPEHYAILGASFTLAPPSLGSDTIFGWFLTADSTRLADRIGMYGGRFDAPVVIPPAGMTLTLDETHLYLHDCGTSPPPPPPPAPYLRDFFTGTAGTALTAHAMDAGPGWTLNGAEPQLQLGGVGCVVSGNFECGNLTDAGAANYVWRQNYVHQADTIPVFIVRYNSAGNLWILFNNAATWSLVNIVGGVSTLISTGGGPLVAGTDYEFVVVVNGASIALLIGATVTFTYGAMATFLTDTGLGLDLAPLGAAIPTGSWGACRIDSI